MVRFTFFYVVVCKEVVAVVFQRRLFVIVDHPHSDVIYFSWVCMISISIVFQGKLRSHNDSLTGPKQGIIFRLHVILFRSILAILPAFGGYSRKSVLFVWSLLC